MLPLTRNANDQTIGAKRCRAGWTLVARATPWYAGDQCSWRDAGRKAAATRAAKTPGTGRLLPMPKDRTRPNIGGSGHGSDIAFAELDSRSVFHIDASHLSSSMVL
jgi:hypothetical protein